MLIDKKSRLWQFLDPEQKDFIADTEYLLMLTETDRRILSDYSFLVFSTAKVYEGFLKKMFYQLGLISEAEYKGERFRVGKALNPKLDLSMRRESVYDRLQTISNGSGISETLWSAWKEGRNLLFHYFPDQIHCITRDEAMMKIHKIISAMNQSIENLLKEPESNYNK